MKTWILIRHAEAASNQLTGDIDRHLSKQGIDDADTMARKLQAKALTPDAIYSSSAARAMHTCSLFLDRLRLDFSKLSIKPELYDFQGEKTLDYIQSLPDSVKTIMSFGHNNACTNIISQLTGQNPHFTTCSIALLQLNIKSWNELPSGKHSVKIITKEDE